MKRLIPIALGFLLMASSAFADIFIVAGYKHDSTNLAARVYQRKDNNDEACGLIMVRTSILNLKVLANTGVVGPVNFKDGDYWVYVSPGTRRISFYKEGFERLDYNLPVPVKPQETYILTLRYRSTHAEAAANSMGFVVIKSTPPGADVYVNDTVTGMQTPFQNSYNEGYYRFTLKKPFYDDYTGSFEITRRKTTRDSITLVPDFGSLRLSFMPSNGVSVNIDGLISTQDSPYSIGKLKTGTHTLVLNKATYDEYRQNFTIQKGQTTTLNINMVPNFGGFSVSTSPEINAKVNIDGIDYEGTTPLSLPKLAPGKHSLRLTKEMYLPEQQSFTISKGKNTQLILPMKPNFSTVNILAGEGDKIFIDNKQAGTGNYNGRLLKGPHIIRVEHANYYAQSRQIVVLPGKNLEERFALQPKTGTLSVMTNPIGANILLNNKPMGQSPRFIDSLMVGAYTVKLVKQGYAPDEKQVQITENQTTTLKESLINGVDVKITSQPSGAELYVDGKDIGLTPQNIRLSLENHSFKVQKKGYLPYVKTLFVNQDQNTRLKVYLKVSPNHQLVKLKRRRNFWFISTLLTAGAGAYSYLQSNKLYNQYQAATVNATNLHNQVNTMDKVTSVALGAAGFCVIEYIIHVKKCSKLKKKIKLYPSYSKNGGSLSLSYNF